MKKTKPATRMGPPSSSPGPPAPVLPLSSDSENPEGWKRPLRPSSPNVNPTPPCLLNCVPKGHIYTFLNTSRDGDSTTSPGSLFQCLTTLAVRKLVVVPCGMAGQERFPSMPTPSWQ